MIGLKHDRAAKDQTVIMGITDLMTSLAVIFILLLTLFIRAQFASRQVTQDIRQDVIDAIIAKLRTSQDESLNQVKVAKDPNDPLGIEVVVRDPLLRFEPDKSNLSEDAKKFLNQFVPLLTMVVCQDQRKNIQTIVIEGHTDRTFPTGKDPDEYNIPLSQNRARSVVEHALFVLKGTDEEGRDCFLNITSVNGRGLREPPMELIGKHDSDITTLDRQAMRRVIFKIRIKSTEQRQGTDQLHPSYQSSTAPIPM
jgi:outer membrane protein OmpA-like peptidoglycan-associated protein